MKKILTVLMTTGACVFIAYAFWAQDIESEGDEHHHEHSHGHHHHDHHEGHHHDHEDTISLTKEQIVRNGVAVSKALPGKLKQTIKAPGKIVVCQDRIAHLYPNVTGTVIKASKNLGQFVLANEVLATIASREIAETKAEYLASYNRAQLTDGNFLREKTLYEKKITPTQEFHSAENLRQESQIELELARQKLHALGLSTEEIDQLHLSLPNQLRVYEMRSPISGKLISSHISQGERVSVDTEAFVVADLTKLWVEISIFPQDRQYVKEGQRVVISTREGKQTKARIAYLSPIINEDTRTSTAIAEIDNPMGHWLPGTFVNAELITEVIDVPLVISKGSIQTIDGNDAVFISSEDGFTVRSVTVGRSNELSCEIIEGLNPGEEYACKNTFLLKAHLQKDEAEHSH